VDASHDFLADADREEIEAHLASHYFPAVQLTIAELDSQPVAFVGTSAGAIEMLFVDATHRGQGFGASLLDHAISALGATRVDVNEQNLQAVRFYSRHGFDVVGRSETDDAGRPYPLLHMRLTTTRADQASNRPM
jgi:putative acetyltransferase